MPGRLEGKVAVITGGAGGIRPRDGQALRRRGRQGMRRATSPTSRAKRWRTEIDGLYVHADVTDPDDVQSVYGETAERFGGHRRALQQRRDLPARRRLDPGHRARRLAARAGREPQERLPVLQVRDPAPPGAGRRLHHQHGLLRGRDGGGHVARSPTPHQRAACSP